MATNKGFIQNWQGENLLPITRAELVLDCFGNIAFTSPEFEAGATRKDGTVNAYGLITAAEKQMISGGASGQGIADIYKKLGYINEGLYINNNLLSFYNSTEATPIKISIADPLTFSNSGNNISIGLETLNTSGLNASYILKSISVDEYGRVTAVSGSALTNDEIPDLEGKAIKDSILDGCTTENKEIGTDPLAIVNKAYVDARIADVSGVATGALHFEGPLSSKSSAIAFLDDKDYFNSYFKVTDTFTLESTYLYDETEGSAARTVKSGDTLIIKQTGTETSKFVIVPSGDDRTLITIKEENQTPIITEAEGLVTFQFAQLFNVEKDPNGNIAKISIPKADSGQNGYLSKDDYIKFSSYADDLKVTYSQTLANNSKLNTYEIGKITISGTETVIYGKNSVSSLTVNDGADQTVYNPVLKFTETGQQDVSITLKGTKGIKVFRNGNEINLVAVNEAVEQAVPGLTDTKVKYITIDNNYQFGVQLGQASGHVVTQHGLTDYNEFNELRKAVSFSLVFKEVATLEYGSQTLADSITI